MLQQDGVSSAGGTGISRAAELRCCEARHRMNGPSNFCIAIVSPTSVYLGQGVGLAGMELAGWAGLGESIAQAFSRRLGSRWEEHRRM